MGQRSHSAFGAAGRHYARAMLRARTLLLPLLVASTAAVAGCGSSGSDTTSTTTAAAAPAATTTASGAATATDGRVTIEASEFKFSPTAITAKPGKLTIVMHDTGKVVHELVVLKTKAAADALKVTGGRVSEKDSVGEISETDAGASKSRTFDLEAGTYVFVCNVPGHYMDGMRGTITVQ